MRKHLALTLLLASPVALSQPYIQLGLGMVEMDHDEDFTFSDGTRLKPDSSESMFQLTLGHRFENLGVEISYNQYEGDESKDWETYTAIPALPAGVTGGTPNEYEEDWDSSLKAQQVAVKGVYFHDLNERFTLKGSLGLTYTDYELTASHTQSWEEDKVGPDWEYDYLVDHYKSSDTAWGGIVSVGVNYTPVPQYVPNLTLGVEASVAADKYNTATALLGNLGWSF